MEINHCYPDSSLSCGNHQKHLGSPCAAFCEMSWGVDGRGGDRWAGREMGGWRVYVCMGGGSLGEMVISTTHQCADALHKHPRAVSKFCLLTNKGNKTEGGWGGDRSPVYSLRTARSLTHQLTRVRLWCLLLSVRDQYFKRPIKEEIELGID